MSLFNKDSSGTLLSQTMDKIPRPHGWPAGALDEQLASGANPDLVAGLATIVGRANVLGRATDLGRYASDASPYRLVPQMVVRPSTPQQVARILAYCTAHGRHATFRAGGRAYPVSHRTMASSLTYGKTGRAWWSQTTKTHCERRKPAHQSDERGQDE